MKGCPIRVEGSFSCNGNKLLNLEGWLKKYGVVNYAVNEDLSVDVEGDVDLSFNGLTEIPIKFGVINGDFDCSSNAIINPLNLFILNPNTNFFTKSTQQPFIQIFTIIILPNLSR